MSDDWLTYAQAAERLNLTVEAVRLRALRGRWKKTIGNDKRPRIRLPDGWSNEIQTTVERRERKPRNDGRTTVERAFVTALEGHVASLKTENERLAAALDILKAELGARSSELAAAHARASDESAKTAQAIAAFQSLAQRLEAKAEAKRPWWRRLVG